MQRYTFIHAEAMPGGDCLVIDTATETIVQQGCSEEEARDLAEELNRHGIDQATTLRRLVQETR